MSYQPILVGTVPNDGTGDPARTGGIKVNNNFTEVYTALGASGSPLALPAALPVAQGGSGATSFTANRIPYGAGTSPIATSANLTFDPATSTLATTKINIATGAMTMSAPGGVPTITLSSDLQISGANVGIGATARGRLDVYGVDIYLNYNGTNNTNRVYLPGGNYFNINGFLFLTGAGNGMSNGKVAFGYNAANEFDFTSDSKIVWTNSTSNYNTPDLGLSRISSGVLGVGNGTVGNASGTIKAAVYILGGYTVATLPAGVVGACAYVTDALAPVWNANAVGGGAVTVKVFYNGANWVVG